MAELGLKPICPYLKSGTLYNEPLFYYTKWSVVKLQMPPYLKEVFGKLNLTQKKDEDGEARGFTPYSVKIVQDQSVAVPLVTFRPSKSYLEIQNLRPSEAESAF